MEQTTALDSKLRQCARVVSRRIRQVEVDASCWIDTQELARLREVTGLDLLGDRISGGRASGAYLQNLYAQCADDAELSALRRAVNHDHLPSTEQVQRLIHDADTEFGWALNETQVSLVAMAVVEVW